MKQALRMIILVVLAVAFAVPGPIRAQDYDVVVIGAGGGGLSAAAKLSLDGMKVLVLEQHDKVGGYMTSFQRGDYTFEVSLHAMDGLGPGGMNYNSLKALDLLGRIKPVRADPMYLLVMPDRTLAVPADVNKYMALLKKMYPHEAEGLDRLYEDCKKTDEAMKLIMGMAQGKSALEIALGFLKKPMILAPFVKYGNATVSEMLDDYIHDPELFAIFTQYCTFTGSSPDELAALFFMIIWNSFHFNGLYYSIGGSQAISNALADVIRENGGEIKLKTLATRILIENGRAAGVRTEDGQEYRCNYVVSNANAYNTFFKLVGREHLPKAYIEKIQSLKIGASAFQVYLGVDHDYTDRFKGYHEIMMNSSYNPREMFRGFKEGIPEIVWFGIVNYSAVDPGVAPPGKNVIGLSSIMPYDWKKGWHENESYQRYEDLKKEVAMVLIKRAEEQLPGLSQHIEVMEVGSPRTMKHYTLNTKGSIFGWDNIPEQSMLKRFKQDTPIKNLYLAGQWTFPGGGQTAVLNSGLMAADKILKDARKR